MDTNTDALQYFSELFDGSLVDFFNSLGVTVGACLVAAAAVYLAFIGWRAFKAAVNKV